MSNNSLNNNSFDCALRSPFSEIYHTAISPPAVLCNDREATYSLSLNGFIKLQSHYHKSVFRSMFFWPVKPHTTTAACFLLPALRQVHLEGDRTAFPPYSLGSVSQRRSSERRRNKGRNKGNKGTVLLETKGRSFCICLPDSQQSEAQTRGRKQKDRPRDLHSFITVPVTYKRTIPVTFILFHVPPPTQATPHISLNLQLQTGRP